MKEKLQLMDNNIRRFAVDSTLHFIEAMFKNAEGVQRGEDPEHLHDMRVASRRLRESIRLFGRYYPVKKADKTMSVVKKVTRTLAIPREMDVNVASLRAYKPRRSQLIRTAREYLLEVFEFEQARRRKKMLKSFDKLDLEALRTALVQLARSATEKSPQPTLLHDVPQDAELKAFLDQAIKALQERAAPVLAFRSTPDQSSASDEELHRLRINVKKYRYCLEILAPLFSERLRSGIELAKILQEVLGQIHDLGALIGHLDTHCAQLKEKKRSLLAKGCQQVVTELAAKKQSLLPQVGPAYTYFLNELHKISTIDSALLTPHPDNSQNPTNALNATEDKEQEPMVLAKYHRDLLASA